MAECRIQLILKDSRDESDFKKFLKNWKNIWSEFIQEDISFNISFSLSREKQLRIDESANFVIIYHTFEWKELASTANNLGLRTIIYGGLGDYSEAVHTAKKGYLYITTSDISCMNWHKMAIISIIACSNQELRHSFLEGSGNLINEILERHLDFQKCTFWDFAQVAQFLDLTCDFYKKIKPKILWLAFLPECDEIKWAYLSKNLLAYLEEVDLIPKGKTFTGPLGLYWHLFLDKQLVDLKELLCHLSPAIRDATLKAIRSTPHKFDHELIKLVPGNNDPLIIKELIEYINKHNL